MPGNFDRIQVAGPERRLETTSSTMVAGIRARATSPVPHATAPIIHPPNMCGPRLVTRHPELHLAKQIEVEMLWRCRLDEEDESTKDAGTPTPLMLVLKRRCGRGRQDMLGLDL